MKIIIDIDQLLSEGSITQIEYDKFSKLSKESIGTLPFNYRFINIG